MQLAESRRRISDVATNVLCCDDILESIVCGAAGNMGPHAFVALSGVSRRTYEVCRTRLVLLRSVSLYTGGLTRGAFCGLFGLTPAAAATFPHVRKGHYVLFGEEAVREVLDAPGAMGQIRQWLRCRAAEAASGPTYSAFEARDFCPGLKRARWRIEDQLHTLHRRRRRLLPSAPVPCSAHA